MRYDILEDGTRTCESTAVDEFLFDIWAIGADHDGYHNAEDLGKLVDELVGISQKAREALYRGELFSTQREPEINISRNIKDTKSFESIGEAIDEIRKTEEQRKLLPETILKSYTVRSEDDGTTICHFANDKNDVVRALNEGYYALCEKKKRKN